MHSVGGTLGPMYDTLSMGPSGTLKARKERKVSLLLRRTSDALHCAGIESLAFSTDGSSLFTASRDATVRSWSAQPPEGRWQASYEGHSNWVNDVAVVENALVTCSSDCSICVWNANAHGVAKPECTLYSHTDYVTCLAAAKDVPVVASAGLRGQVLLWDLPSTVRSAKQNQPFKSIDQGSPLGSVYALDINARGNTVAVGSPEGLIRISDARTATKSFKLRGHTDNIRAVLLNGEGMLCLSASSDNTIRLWDLGQQRCVQTFAVHTDSVWTVLASPDFSLVYSGGRDNCVYRTHVASRSSELLFEEQSPINSLAMGESTSELWCATTDSTVRCWSIPPPDFGGGGGGGGGSSGHLQPTSPRTPSRHSSRVFHAGPSPQVRHRQRMSFGHRPESADCRVAEEIRGIPPLVRFATLADRRHVLTQDSGGMVALWDIACGAIVEQYGKVDMAEKEQQLFKPESVAPWFTADVKLGSLAIHLETPSCFAAEVYATELGRVDAPDDLKFNYGENLLKAALQNWVKGLAASYVASGSANGAGPTELAAAASCFQLQGDVPPLLIGQLQADGGAIDTRMWSKATTELDGSEKIGEMIPKWVADAVLYHRIPAPAELKCAFVLLPTEGSGLPSLLQSRLNAPRILKISKVASYVVTKLAEEGVPLEPRRLYYDPSWQAQLEAQRRESNAQAGKQEVQELEFVCNGQAVPFDLSLAGVRSFIWRRSDNLVIHFRIYNPNKPAPLPVVKPP